MCPQEKTNFFESAKMSRSDILVVKDFLIEFNINLIFKLISPRTVYNLAFIYLF